MVRKDVKSVEAKLALVEARLEKQLGQGLGHAAVDCDDGVALGRELLFHVL